MKNLNSYLLLIVSFICYSATGQSVSFLNGSFETNTLNVADGNFYNKTNSIINSTVSNVNAFGVYEKIDVLTSYKSDGSWSLGIANNPTNTSESEAIALELDGPLVTGSYYKITYSYYNSNTYGTYGEILIGASVNNNDFGSQIHRMQSDNYSWNTVSFDFLATSNARYITVKPNPGTQCWIYIDNFILSDSTYVDSIAPTVTLTDTEVDNVVKDIDNVTITATFNENMANTPQISIGSLLTNVDMTAVSSTTWTYVWNVPSGNNGTVTATVSGTDIAGNAYSGSDSITFTIDNSTPTVTLSDTDADNVVKDIDNVTITATFNENMANTPEISIGSILTNVAMTAVSSTTWTYVWNVPSGNNGTVTATVSGTDVAGNAYSGSDSITFTIDNSTSTAPPADTDNDGIIDLLDNCPTTPNSDQLDSDGDGIGNVCDSDNDDDGWNDTIETACGTNPLSASSKPVDTDGDGIANCLDSDDDNDGCLDTEDVFPLDRTECSDADNDGTGDNADTDDDNDGQSDIDELKCGSNPYDASSMSADFDGDGILDCIDEDDDNDGVKDYADAFPFDVSEWADYDQDGIGNNADTDDDNDGWSDAAEENCGTNPLMVVSQPTDLDKDGIADCEDTDIDDDGVLNTEDAFPTNPNEWADNDKDGVGDNLDVDDDNDGVLDTEDAFPMNSSESKDSDGDGVGDNSDPDMDNDGFEDSLTGISGFLTPSSGNIETKWVVANIKLYPNAHVRIYNINGVEVFSKIGYQNDWKGTFKDTEEKLPAGSYYYTIDYHREGKKKEGWLYLVY